MTDTRPPAAPDDPIVGRLRSAGTVLAAAADAHRPAPTGPTAGRAVRSRRPLLAAAVVAAMATAAGVAHLASEDSDRDRQVVAGPSTGCDQADDLLVLGYNSGAQDPSGDGFIDGRYSLGALRAGDDDPSWLNHPDNVVRAPSFDPSGSQVAVTWAEGDYESAGPDSESIWAIDVDDGEARPITDGPRDTDPEWSPDGRWIAYSTAPTEGADLGGTRGLAIVPAQGGTPRRLGDLGETRWADGHAWSPDGRSIYGWDAVDTGSTIWRFDLEGGRTEVATVAGRIGSAELVPGGRELLAEVSSVSSGDPHWEAIDVATGATRRLAGPTGPLRWSRDGQRLYLLLQGVVYRARYGETAIEAAEPVADHRVGISDLAVGPCGPITPTGPRPHQPLVGTDWRLGSRQVVISDGPGRPACAAPECATVRIEMRDEPGQDPPCAVIVAERRNDALTAAEVEVVPETADPVTGPSCWLTRSFTEHPPDRLEVRGDQLRIRVPAKNYVWWLNYGARYVGPEPPPVDVPEVTGPAIDPVTVTTTTAPPPAATLCSVVTSFGDQLGSSTARSAPPEAITPVELGRRAELVVRGHLIDTGLSTLSEEDRSALVYALRVEEVLRLGDDVTDASPGSVLSLVVPFSFDGQLPPTLGDLAGLGPDAVPKGTAIPVVAFLTASGPGLAEDWYLDGPSGLAVGCPGEPGSALTGLVGDDDAWRAVADLDALAELVRGG